MSKPRTSKSLLQEALAVDAAGDSPRAIPLYRRALAQGLAGDDLRVALLGLGASLRAAGSTKAAIRTLQKARRLFPRDGAVLLFLALAHFAAGQHALAVRQLADTLLNESRQPQLAMFRRALARHYHACR